MFVARRSYGVVSDRLGVIVVPDRRGGGRERIKKKHEFRTIRTFCAAFTTSCREGVCAGGRAEALCLSPRCKAKLTKLAHGNRFEAVALAIWNVRLGLCFHDLCCSRWWDRAFRGGQWGSDGYSGWIIPRRGFRYMRVGSLSIIPSLICCRIWRRRREVRAT